MENTIVGLKDIVVDFDGETVLDGLSLDIHDKEFVTLLGPSGCGKTTTLRVIGGFIEPKSGNVFFDDKDITKLPAYKRQVNTVFQKYALFPHLNVYENVAFGLRLRKVEEKELKTRVLEMLELVGLRGFERRDPDHPFGRSAAAGCDCQSAGQPSQGAAAGRTAGRARPQAPQRDADPSSSGSRRTPTSPLSM